MVQILEQVQCFHCGKKVNKTSTRLVRDVNNIPQPECFSCFMVFKSPAWQKTIQLKERYELYCERCRYKFYSKKLLCPYCNNSDFICKGNLSIHDLVSYPLNKPEIKPH